MTARELGVPILTLAIGIAAGLATQSPPPAAGSASSVSRPETGAPRQGAAAVPETARRDLSRPAAASSQEEVRVSVSIKAVGEFLKKSGQLSRCTFEDLGENLEEPMTLLDVSAGDQEKVQDMLDASEEEILAAEKGRLKLEKADHSAIVVDLSGMEEPVARITAQTRDRLAGLLPPEVAKALSDAVNWDGYYFASSLKKVSFLIKRQDGMPYAYQDDGPVMTGRAIDAARFPDDGTPIPADQIFSDPRWASLLAGHTLLPPAKK